MANDERSDLEHKMFIMIDDWTSASLVGNDVVDLRDPDIARHHERSRFVARVCTPDEVARVAASDDPHRVLWTLFAAKEAGFKVVAKLTPGIASRRGGLLWTTSRPPSPTTTCGYGCE